MNEDFRDQQQKYCEWLSKIAQQFQHDLAYYGVHPTYGIETQTYIDQFKPGNHPFKIGAFSVFDLPIMRGIVFDDTSKQFVLYQYQSQLYHQWANKENVPNNAYAYKIFPYSSIVKADVESTHSTNQSTKIQSVGGSGNVLLGGIVAGVPGAVIASSITDKQVITQNTSILLSTSLTIHTTDNGYEAIRFIANRLPGQSSRTACADTEIGDAMKSTFSDVPFSREFRHIRRQYGTTQDVVFMRGNNQHLIWNSNLESIAGRFAQYAEYINQITGTQQDKISQTNHNDSNDGIFELEILRNLKLMLDEGLITQAEYDSKKTEILSRM